MAQQKKRKKYKRKSGSTSWGLGATPAMVSKQTDRMQLGLSVLSFALGQTIGAAVGKTSGYVGALITGAGVWKKNMFATSFGAGMTLSEANGPSGFSMENIKERSMGFVKTVGEKFISPMGESTPTTDTATNGLGEGEQQPKYFLNPYTQNADFSQAMRDLENIETQVREVSGIADDMDMNERNY